MELHATAERSSYMVTRRIDTYQTGLFGEDVVSQQLEQDGWTVLARRARTKWGELDLVLRRADMISFVEVKVASPGRRDIWNVIDERAQHRLRRAAVAWMAMSPRQQRGVLHYRFDVAVVHMNAAREPTEVDIITNAF